jgi:hypothetical protein
VERRNFIKLTGTTVIGVSLPYSHIANNLFFLPVAPSLWGLYAWRTIKVLFEIASMIHTAYSIKKDLFSGNNINLQSMDMKLNSDGYKLKEAISIPLPNMPQKYSALIYARVNSGVNNENTQMLFSAKVHERQELVALLPESMIFALCCAVRDIKNKGVFDLVNNEADKAKFKSIFFPIMSEGEYIKQNFQSITYETQHGHIKFVGKLVKDVNGKPIRLKGDLEIYPSVETSSNENVTKLMYDDEKLDFIYV